MAISALKVRLSRKILIRRKKIFQILSKYIIRDGLSQKTISRYCPFKQRDIGNFMSFCNHGPSIMSRSFLNSGTLIVLLVKYIGKTPRNIPVWQKMRQSIPQLIQFNRGTAGGTVNLHVFQVRLKKRIVSSPPLSLVSPSFISPSISLPL